MWEIGMKYSFEIIMVKREKCGKKHDMNNVNNVNIDFIYNYIYWASCRSLYFFPSVAIASSEEKKSKFQGRGPRKECERIKWWFELFMKKL